MQNKAPQGNHDSSPTPERELERYGVWVKAEPQDVIDEPTIARKTLDSASSGETDAVLLSEEEEGILDSFDLPDELVEDRDETSTETSPESFDDLSLDEPFELTEELPEELAEEPLAHERPSASEDSIVDMSLDDFDFEPSAEPASQSEIPAKAGVEAASAADTFATTDISIEEFGLGDELENAQGPSLESLGMPEPEAAPSAPPPEAPTDEFESLDIDLQFDDTIPSADTSESVDALGFDSNEHDLSAEFESVDIDSIGAEPATASTRAPAQPAPHKAQAQAVPPAQTISMDSFIDHEDGSMANVMPDLGLDTGSDKAEQPSRLAAQAEASPDLLKQIALELSSIKEELVSLRSQLGSLKADAGSQPAGEPRTDAAEDAVSGGFFDDEDDDTIALTGDELDNILNTADFTEEAALADELNEAEAPVLEVPEEIDLLPEDGDYASQTKPGIEAIELPTVEPTAEEAETLESLVALDESEGLTPLTPLPDDTSFLDEESGDTLAELDGMPLEDVPLLEPNPSDLDVLIDSTFGTEDEELPMAEAAVEELEEIEPFELPTESEASELVLDVQGEEKPVVSTVDAFPETIEEIDEVMALDEEAFGSETHGIDLHTEVASPFAEPVEELELLESIDDDDSYVSSTEPVESHPDDIPTSLDDSLFVEAASTDELVVEPELKPEPELQPEIVEQPVPPRPQTIAQAPKPAEAQAEPALPKSEEVPDRLRHDVKSVLLYLDQLLASLPEEKIEEFASSEYYDTYKRLFDDLGLL